MNSTFAYPLPNRYQNIINSLIKHIDMDVVSGLSRQCKISTFDYLPSYRFFDEFHPKNGRISIIVTWRFKFSSVV